MIMIIAMVGVEEGRNNGVQQLGFRNWNVFVSRHGNSRNVLILEVIVGHVAVVVLPLVESGFQGLGGHVGKTSEGRARTRKRKTLTMSMRNWGKEA